LMIFFLHVECTNIVDCFESTFLMLLQMNVVLFVMHIANCVHVVTIHPRAFAVLIRGPVLSLVFFLYSRRICETSFNWSPYYASSLLGSIFM
jgi:hypothetical protein